MKTTLEAATPQTLAVAIEEFKKAYLVETVGSIKKYHNYTMANGHREWYASTIIHRGKVRPNYTICGKKNHNGDECLRRIKHRGSHSLNPDKDETLEVLT